jgi:iron complex transport system substrate-binding protein
MTAAKTALRARRALLPTFIALAVAAFAAPAQAAPKRIVALTPFSANTLANLGVEPVAIGQTLGGKERFSPKLKGVETLTLSHPNGPNMEELAILNPQLVFSSPTWAKGAKTMRELEIKVVNSDPTTVGEVYEQTRAIGARVGKASAAKRLAAKLKRQVANARKGIRKRPRVLLILGVGRTPFVFLPNSWGGNLVVNAGAQLVTGGVRSKSGFARISDETILKKDPDVILAVPHANADDIPKVKEFLESNPAWEDSKAVREDRLYVSTDNSLLQAGTDVARVIRQVRRRYLDN